jgi:starch-binding outer membrane protein, SusD/RagB family
MNTRILAWVAVAAVMAACESPLDTNPTASIDATTALTSKRGIDLALNGVYRIALSGNLYGRDHTVYADLYGDNLDFSGTFTTDREISLRNPTTGNGDVLAIWSTSYQGISRANYILDALPTVSDMTDAQKALARGEALFERSLYYYILNNWYGGVPLVLEHSEGVSDASLVARNTTAEVWAQVEKDIEEAITLLGNARVNGKATQGAANALAARVYLEDGKYDKARDKATAVINNALYKLTNNYADNFRTKNSTESILEVQSTINSTNSLAFWYFPVALGGRYGFNPSTSLDQAFEAGDTRKATTIAFSGALDYSVKFNRISTQDDNLPVLRLSEQYLIRAEANARLGAADAIVLADLNVVRARAGLAASTAAGQTALLDAILRERRVELALEGHRFFDLRRHGRATTVLGISASRLVFPIPQAERDVNANLAQNPGY